MIASIDSEQLPACVKTSLQTLISFIVSGIVCLIGFALSISAVNALISYKDINVYYGFKIIFVLNIVIFWVIFCGILYVHFYCYEANVAMDEHHHFVDTTHVIVIQIIVSFLMISQVIMAQIISIERIYNLLLYTTKKLRKKDIWISVWLSAMGTVLLWASVLFYYASYTHNYNHLWEYTIVTMVLGIFFDILSHGYMFHALVKRFYRVIYSRALIREPTRQSGSKKYKRHQSDGNNTITPFPNNETINSLIPVKNEANNSPQLLNESNKLVLTLNNDSNVVSPVIKELNVPLLNTSQSLNENKYSIVTTIKTERSDRTNTTHIIDDSHITENIERHDRIIKTSSKFIIIALFSYIIFCFPITCIILSSVIKNYDDILSLITANILLLCSMYSILYMYIHFQFSDELYKNRLLCFICFKCDDILIRKASEMAMIRANIHEKSFTTPLTSAVLSTQHSLNT